MTERRCGGVIRAIDRQRGYGLIACPELAAVFGCDVFLDGRQIGAFVEGQSVSFAVTLTRENKPQAFDLMERLPPAATGAAGAGVAVASGTGGAAVAAGGGAAAACAPAGP